jgi:predicted MPP superfamily phosphohydrolase
MESNRRRLLKRVGLTALGGLTATGTYPFLEAKWCRVSRQTITVPHLPTSFRGTTLALITDVHHGPFVPLVYLRHIVETTNALKPDLVLLGGDYVSQSWRYVAPGIDALSKLQARLGRFAVLGNHDHWESEVESDHALRKAGITRTDNTGFWIERGGRRLRICGVGDLWTDRQNSQAAIGDATEHDTVIMLSHNPDFAEVLNDRRVGLMLSGHTHGGQVVVPGYGAPIVPSRYGQKYLQGLVQGPSCQVFVSRGVGTVSPPVRFFCRPEVVLITLI